MSFRLIGTGSSLPKRVVTNDDLSQFLDTSDEWIYSRTGIRQRHENHGHHKELVPEDDVGWYSLAGRFVRWAMLLGESIMPGQY